jgi:hypothetical protein
LHIYACCKHIPCFKVFHMYVCKCFIRMLHMFAMVFKCFSGVFTSVLDACFKRFICLLFVCCNCCIWMFQKWIGCYIWDTRETRLTAQTMCGTTHEHYWYAPREPDALCTCSLAGQCLDACKSVLFIPYFFMFSKQKQRRGCLVGEKVWVWLL